MNDRNLLPWQIYRLPAGQPKARPRVTRNGTFMPRGYSEWKEQVAEELADQGASITEGPIKIELQLRPDRSFLMVTQLNVPDIKRTPSGSASRSGLLTGDIDNYLGGVMDAAEGILWLNDRDVWGASVWLDS